MSYVRKWPTAWCAQSGAFGACRDGGGQRNGESSRDGVNVALHHIGQEFGASVSALQWVLTGYLLALASLILLGGALGDRFGRRRVFVIGAVWFAAASLCAVRRPTSPCGMRVHHQVGGPDVLAEPGELAADPCFEAAAVGGVRDGDGSSNGRVSHGARRPTPGRVRARGGLECRLECGRRGAT